ncbi:hypothetical protein BCV70DRAFT_201059 [Testicularia cyperi]|uniref:Uncharacterized protein n=1 Tax=Testicularia cyperi TaxID=1882483 RepID=A0A317XQ79_9BASI|nr:hypothetical protein BCV70DRAFT_201059 [Testicularia cyperi]
MPEQFPKLGLDGPADLDHVLKVVSEHAHKVAQMEFGNALEKDKALKTVLDKVIKRVSAPCAELYIFAEICPYLYHRLLMAIFAIHS